MSRRIRTAAVIVASGSGNRFGGCKQIEPLRGKTVLDWSLTAFQNHEAVNEMILVLKPELIPEFRREGYAKLTAVVSGGATRQDSVAAGVFRIHQADLVLIHDGVRPLPGAALISRVITAAEKTGAAVPGIALEDTLKEILKDGSIITRDRTQFFRTQTPQGFKLLLFKDALVKARSKKFTGTDDVSLVERLGCKIERVAGSRKNIKITTPWDLQLAEVLFDLPDGNRV